MPAYYAVYEIIGQIDDTDNKRYKRPCSGDFDAESDEEAIKRARTTELERITSGFIMQDSKKLTILTSGERTIFNSK